MTKEQEALKLALEALEYEADKGNDNAYQRERDAIKQALAAQPTTEESSAVQPAPILPDHLTYDEPETREYINGWNDCRQAMLESLRKPT